MPRWEATIWGFGAVLSLLNLNQMVSCSISGWRRPSLISSISSSGRALSCWQMLSEIFREIKFAESSGQSSLASNSFSILVFRVILTIPFIIKFWNSYSFNNINKLQETGFVIVLVDGSSFSSSSLPFYSWM